MGLLGKKALSFGLLALLACLNAWSAQKPAASPAKATAQTGTKPPGAKPASLDVPQLKFEKYQLENGLEVILSEDHRLPMVAVNLWYHVGPANELPGRTGFAHLFEHMMFEGSRHVPGSSHFHYLEAAGASDINGTTDFDRTNYFETLPSNQPEKARELVNKYFGPLKRGEDVPKIKAHTPAITSERHAVIHDNVQLPRVYMGWLTSPIFKPGDAEADLAATILGGGKSSRLYKKLVYEKQIAQDVAVNQQSLILGSVFEVQATAKSGVKPEDLEKAINAELDAFRKDGPTAAELTRARNVIESRIIAGLETLGGFGGVADRLNSD